MPQAGNKPKVEVGPRGKQGNVMTEDAYGSLARRANHDFRWGDLDLVAVVMREDVVWHKPGRSSLAGDDKGLEAVLGFFGRLKARSYQFDGFWGAASA